GLLVDAQTAANDTVQDYGEGSEEEREGELLYRRRRPTVPPAPQIVRATLRDRRPLELAHSWLVVPALGPVLPTLSPEGTIVADPSGGQAPFEVRGQSSEQ